MASNVNSDSNDQTITIPELLKILPKCETTLQVRMQNSSSGSSNHNHHNHHHNHRNNHLPNSNKNNNNNNNNNINGNSKNTPCYHTLRYDFKPASVNSDEPATLELTQNGQVTIKAPNVGGSISSQTVFKGQRRSHVKECLLVIDNKTGEMVLQRLTDNITVKATRSLGGVGGSATTTGPVTASSSSSSSGISTATTTSTTIPMTTATTTTTAPPTITNSYSTQSDINMGANNINNASGKMDGPQLSEESSDSSDDSDSSSSSSGSSSSSSGSTSSSSSSSSSGNSSPNNEGFTF